MLKPIFFENDEMLIHPFRPDDMERYEQFVSDVFSILTDDQTLTYIPEKRLKSLEEAEGLLQTMIINYHSRRNYVHFITAKKSDKVVGIIDLISPEVAKEFYTISSYPYFIEFYLSSSASGCYVMTKLLPRIVDHLLAQGIPSIGAVVNKKNIAAKRVLEKAKFARKGKFDALQDLYETLSP